MSPFSPNQTIPPGQMGFVEAPPTRGTMGIIWSCGSVLLLCTWSVLHLNVPSQRKVSNKREFSLRLARRFLAKFIWMIINLMAPEWTFAKALVDFRSVQELKELRELADEDRVPWSDTHTHFANMGGFGFKFEVEVEAKIDLRSTRDPSLLDWENEFAAIIREPLAITLYKIMNRSVMNLPWQRVGVQVDKQNSQLVDYALFHINGAWLPDEASRNRCLNPDRLVPNMFWLKGDVWVLDGRQLLMARKLGIINRLPHITNDNLSDRNKGNALIKFLALAQIIWFSFQLCTRLSRHLATSQLEIMTFAFSIASGASYLLLLDKPQDVQYTTVLSASRRPQSPAEIVQIASMGPSYPATSFLRRTPWFLETMLPYTKPVDGEGFIVLGSSIILAAFGGIHCLGWNYATASAPEHTLWQVSSVITATALPCLYLSHLVGRRIEAENRRSVFLQAAVYVLGVIFAILFVGARLFILIEVFRSLAFLPPEAFITVNVANLPHIT